MLIGYVLVKDRYRGELDMSIPSDADTDKLAEAALAILWLGAHGDGDATRVWKQIDWELTGLLYETGLDLRSQDQGAISIA